MYGHEKAMARRKEVAQLQEQIAKTYGASVEPLGELEVIQGQSRLRRRGKK